MLFGVEYGPQTALQFLVGSGELDDSTDLEMYVDADEVDQVVLVGAAEAVDVVILDAAQYLQLVKFEKSEPALHL